MDRDKEFLQNIRRLIKSKLIELEVYVDDELVDYITVLLVNKKTASQMIEDLNLFLSEHSENFVVWLFNTCENINKHGIESNVSEERQRNKKRKTEEVRIKEQPRKRKNSSSKLSDEEIIIKQEINNDVKHKDYKLRKRCNSPIEVNNKKKQDKKVSNSSLLENSSNYGKEQKLDNRKRLIDKTQTVKITGVVSSVKGKNQDAVDEKNLYDSSYKIDDVYTNNKDYIDIRVNEGNFDMSLYDIVDNIPENIKNSDNIEQISHKVIANEGHLQTKSKVELATPKSTLDSDDVSILAPFVQSSVMKILYDKKNISNQGLFLKALQDADLRLKLKFDGQENDPPKVDRYKPPLTLEEVQQQRIIRFGASNLESQHKTSPHPRSASMERTEQPPHVGSRVVARSKATPSSLQEQDRDPVHGGSGDDDRVGRTAPRLTRTAHNDSALARRRNGVGTGIELDDGDAGTALALERHVGQDSDLDDVVPPMTTTTTSPTTEFIVVIDPPPATVRGSDKRKVVMHGLHPLAVPPQGFKRMRAERSSRSYSEMGHERLDERFGTTEDDFEYTEGYEEGLEDDEENFEEDTGEGEAFREKCKFWPGCKNGDSCMYHHPTIQCKNFPHCTYGDKCHYIHPNCKFDAYCTKKDCPYTHSTSIRKELGHVLKGYQPTSLAPVLPISGNRVPNPVTIGKGFGNVSFSKIPCKFGAACLNKSCQYLHPPECKFGQHCTRHDCVFTHPSNLVQSKMKWVSQNYLETHTKFTPQNFGEAASGLNGAYVNALDPTYSDDGINSLPKN